MYKPLPNNLTISTSKIHDCGIFAKENIPEQTNLGMTHLELGKLILRTPLGGFLNHSNTPNCVKSSYLLTRQEWNHLQDLPDEKYNHNFKKWNLITIKNIKKGEELTLKYTFYTVKKDFLEEAEKEKKELEESYQESIRQTKKRKNFYPKAIDGYSE